MQLNKFKSIVHARIMDCIKEKLSNTKKPKWLHLVWFFPVLSVMDFCFFRIHTQLYIDMGIYMGLLASIFIMLVKNEHIFSFKKCKNDYYKQISSSLLEPNTSDNFESFYSIKSDLTGGGVILIEDFLSKEEMTALLNLTLEEIKIFETISFNQNQKDYIIENIKTKGTINFLMLNELIGISTDKQNEKFQKAQQREILKQQQININLNSHSQLIKSLDNNYPLYSDLPQSAKILIDKIQKLCVSLKNETTLDSKSRFDVENIEGRVLFSTIEKYQNVDPPYRLSLKNTNGKNATNILLDSLTQLLQILEEITVDINQNKLKELTINDKYISSLKYL